MNSTWLTLAVAALSGFFALAGHWLNGAQTRRRAVQDRDARRAERRADLRNEVYSKVVLEMDMFANALGRSVAPAELLIAVANLRRAAAPAALQSRQLTDGVLRDLLVAADHLAVSAQRSATFSPARSEALTTFETARVALLDAMAADLVNAL